MERRGLRGSPRRRTAVTPTALTSGRRRRRPSRPRSTRSWQENDLDAIIALTNGPAWPTNDDPNEGDLDGHFEYFVGSSGAAAVSGYADITVPAGYVAGLPIGITFIGGRWAEPELLGLAYDYEQATQVRVPPRVHPDDRRRSVPRRPEPAGGGAGAAAAGDPRAARSRRALPVEERAETTKPGHSAGLRAVGRLLRTRPAGDPECRVWLSEPPLSSARTAPSAPPPTRPSKTTSRHSPFTSTSSRQGLGTRQSSHRE